jgi:hypothetical protein
MLLVIRRIDKRHHGREQTAAWLQLAPLEPAQKAIQPVAALERNFGFLGCRFDSDKPLPVSLGRRRQQLGVLELDFARRPLRSEILRYSDSLALISKRDGSLRFGTIALLRCSVASVRAAGYKISLACTIFCFSCCRSWGDAS